MICFLRLFIAISLIGFTQLSLAQTPEDEPANYAFATYMGSGLFSASNNSLFVLNASRILPMDKRPDIRLRLSGSAGFFDYDRGQIGELEVPDSIGTLTFIPGIEKVYTIQPDWELIPNFDLGISQNFATHEKAFIYSVGGQSRYYMDAPVDHHLWVNKIMWAAAEVLGSDQRDNYVKLLTGFDYKTNTYLDLAAGHTVLTAYSLLAWSYNGIDYQERWKGDIERDLDVEFGISLYALESVDFGLFDLKRLGVGLQHTAFGNVVRLFVGTPF